MQDQERLIVFSRHALDEAGFDGISEDEMRFVMGACPWVPNEAGRFGESGWSAQGVVGMRTICVIFVETVERDGTPIIKVVTTWAVKQEGR